MHYSPFLIGEKSPGSSVSEENAWFGNGVKSNGSFDSTHLKEAEGSHIGRHRASCHRCGNMRRKNVLCTECPHIYCARCSAKLVIEFGPDIFDNGCPVVRAISRAQLTLY